MIRCASIIFGLALGLGVSGHGQVQRSAGVARITGTAVHPNGTPALGAVEIEPVSAENPTAVAVISGMDGSFATEKLPAGRYRVGVDLGINRQPDEAYGRSYFPGTADPTKATEVEITAGSPDPHIVFIVPELRPTVELRGNVVFADGTPAAKVDVFFSPVGGYSIGQMWTDDYGNYVATRYGGVAYGIRSKSRDSKYESEVQLVEAADLGKAIRLILLPSPRRPEIQPH